ncbi:MAG: maltose alpha-D-glucosyltransferase [Chlamydiales bacterium]|nr:maltose alpha-D-glucosyltransferase [Chlamydiales bacterium]
MGDEEHWYKEAIIYELHVKCFYDSSGDGYGDFRGLTQKLDYLQDLGVTAIWLLPFYPSPLKDDGYDIADYTNVHPQYGRLRDFKRFLREAHRRGLRVITELVVNHTSDQHPWFQRARYAEKGSNHRNFYVWNDSPDKYKDARIIFQDFENSNWTWDPVAQSYFWHRFYSHQPDLNFDNPEVHKAIFQKLSFWMKLGVDGVRLDAVPYLYEREGTICENLPETHLFLKKLRAYIDTHFEERMLLAEANQWPEDAAKYFGDGDECHMAFHFPVMPRLFMSIHLEDSLPIIEIMGQTPQIPSICQWALFLRNHDELTLEMVTDEERDYMFRVYAHDPQARVNLGIRRRLAPLLKNDRRKIELMNALLFSLTGTPVLYYGDEIGMGDNIYLGDRDAVRTPMQWSNDRNAGFSRANPQQLYLPPIIDPEYHYETLNVEAQLNNPYSLLWWTKQLIALRKRYKALSYGTTEFLVPQNRKTLIFFREYKDELLMILANLSRFSQYVELDLKKYNGYSLVEMFSGQRFPQIGELPYFLTLGPYGYYWFSLEKQREESVIEAAGREREEQIFDYTLQKESARLFHSSMRYPLERILSKYLTKRGWFQSYLPLLDKTKTKIVDHFHLSKQDLELVLLEITLTTGIVHQLPIFIRYLEGEQAREKMEHAPENVIVNLKGLKRVTVLYDCGMEPGLGEVFLDAILNRRRYRSEEGELRGVTLTKVRESVPLLSLGEKDIEEIQRNHHAVIFPLEKGVLKIFSLIEEGMDLDVEMRLFLTQKTDFRAFLPLLGYIEYSTHARTTVALAEEIVSYRREFNAKELAIEAADRFLVRMEAKPPDLVSDERLFPSKTLLSLAEGKLEENVHALLEEHLESARLLGETTAAFHRALCSYQIDPDFASIPFTLFYQRSIYQTIRRKILEAFNKLQTINHETLGEEINQLLGFKERLLNMMKFLPHHKLQAERTRYHGNYMLENLQYTGKEFLIANFEGNPNLTYTERRYKRSPLLDCASILLSLAEAGFEAVDRLKARSLLREEQVKLANKWAHLWSLWNGSSFLRAYFRSLGEVCFLPQSRKEIDFLLGLFLIERSAERVATAKEGRLDAPIATLLYWLPIYETITLHERF